MNYYDEEFYSEPSEFEMQIEEFKSSLLDSVKDEYKQRMEKLQKENEELQSVKENFESIKRDYAKKERDLEIAKNNLVSKVRRERLSQIMQDTKVTLFRVTNDYVKGAKCNGCNAQRKIEYLSPSGKKMYEDCACNVSTPVKVPREEILVEFNIRNGVNAWYKILKEDTSDEYMRYDSSTYMRTLFKPGMEFEKLNTYDTFFESEEDCQKYCDYLNSKEAE